MPDTLDPSVGGPDGCGACAGIGAATPTKLDNRAGLAQLALRIGTHSRFLTSMQARLSDAQHPRLHDLNTRDTGDLTIALLDACAAVDDGLTFYMERYGNEWYVRTATERVSLVQLARLIGYEPRPGVAASTVLAFTIETTPGTPETTTIPAGTRVLSIPGKDQLPQPFETTVSITGRARWNAMRIRTRTPQQVSSAMTLVVVQGIESGIRRGDSVLIVESDTAQTVKRVQRVVQEPASGATRLELSDQPAPSGSLGGLTARPLDLSTTALLDSSFEMVFTGQVYHSSDVTILGSVLGWQFHDFTLAANTTPPPPPAITGVYALRQRAAIFGHNAPRWATLPQVVDDQNQQIIGRVLASSSIPTGKWQYPTNWDALDARARSDPDDLTDALPQSIDLDNTYPAITEGSWVVLQSPVQTARAYRVGKNQELTRNDFALSVKSTRLELTGAEGLTAYKMRDTTVLAQSEQLPLALVPVDARVQGSSVVLDSYYPDLLVGQQVVVQGERADLIGVPGTEVRTLAEVLIDGTLEAGRLFTTLAFTTPLDYSYVPETVVINANVAPATHGETRAEVLGGGDGVTRYQTFALKHTPLTYTSAQTPTGAQAALEVRVSGIRWDEVPSLAGRAPDERVYVVRHEDSGQTRLQLNAPIPTGQEHVRATYRTGIGIAGMLNANQLSLLAIKPLGVRSVTNPLAPTGAADRETLEALRENSPLTVLTLDRLVSLQDYEDFARAFAGFSKALATPTADGANSGVFLTVAGETGQIAESDAAFGNLVAALRQYGDPFVAVVVKPYRAAFFQIEATIGVDPAFLAEDVVGAVQSMLMNTFGFAKRQFGQSVTKAAVIAAIQQVPGVVFVDLNALFRTDPLSQISPTLADVLSAALPVAGTSSLLAEAAELLVIDPRPIPISTVMT